MRPAGRIGLSLVALTLLVVATVPFEALADHTYAHRYYIAGRVVDKDGFPVSNITVRVYLDSGTQVGGRDTEKDIRVYQTDCRGFYGWNIKDQGYRDGNDPTVTHSFLHIHEPRTSGILKIEAVDAPYPLAGATRYQGTGPLQGTFRNNITVWASATPAVDPVLRAAFTNLQLDVAKPENRCAGAKEQFDRTYTVMGRLMREINREDRDGGGIVVSEPIAGSPVKATLRYNSGKVAEATVNTDSVGDYVLTLNLTEPLTEGKLTLEANGETREYNADTTFKTTTVGEFSEPIPWYNTKWFRFLAIAGGIAIVVGGVAYFLGRSPKGGASSGRKGKR